MIFETGDIGIILVASIVSLLTYCALDMFWKLPEKGGVSGADAIGKAIKDDGGDIHGGWMIGNITTSPDASAGFMLAACGYWICGIPGGVVSAILVFLGARICADKGYVGFSGAIIATICIWFFNTFANFPSESFIAGMIIAILVVQGISHTCASKILGTIWRRFS